MKISLNAIGKRYNKQWIFKDMSYCFEEGKSYAITGNNGSGKSTLLQCIIGAIQLSKGTIDYTIPNQKISATNTFEHISFAAPYLELIEEMTLMEMLEFHQKFKPFYESISIQQIIELIGLATAQQKQIGNFSSGMKQRLKLALAFFSKSTILCLDEPTSNLDINGISLYQNLIKNFTQNRTLIICSNVKEEYSFCNEIITLENFK